MQRATAADRVALTDLLRSIRTDWDRWLIESILQSHAHQVDLPDLIIATVRYARDETNTDPRGMAWRGRHWRDLATAPERVANQRIRCFTCGKTEDRCITERPGPDDHRFEPTNPHDLPLLRNAR